MLFEIIAIGSAFSSALMIGFFWGVKTEVNEAKNVLVNQKEMTINQMKEFDVIIDKASKSNQSLGILCKDMQAQITIIDEHVAVLGGTVTQQGSSKPWMKTRP